MLIKRLRRDTSCSSSLLHMSDTVRMIPDLDMTTNIACTATQRSGRRLLVETHASHTSHSLTPHNNKTVSAVARRSGARLLVEHETKHKKQQMLRREKLLRLLAECAKISQIDIYQDCC